MLKKYGVWVLKLFPTLIKLYVLTFIYSHNPKRKSRLVRYRKLRKIMKRGNHVFGVEFYIEGMEQLKVKQSYLIAPNHQSMLDPILFIDICDDPISFVTKNNLEHKFMAGNGIRSFEGLFLDRENLRQEIKVMKNVENSLKNDNLRWLIFPEGTRTKNENLELNEYKPGAFKSAQKAGVDIVPVAMFGSHRVLQTNIHWKKYPVQISFLKPITKEEYENLSTVELANLIQSRVNEKMLELKQKDIELIKPYSK